MNKTEMTSSIEKEVLEELRKLREQVERIEALLEERLIGSEEPESDELEAIKKYEEAKKNRDISFIMLKDVKV